MVTGCCGRGRRGSRTLEGMDPVLRQYVDANLPTPAVTATDDGGSLLVLTRRLGGSAEQVWGALTEPAQQKQWTPCVSDRVLDEVGPATIQEAPSADPADGTVLTCERPSLLVHRWGDDTMTWQLEAEDGGGTLLRMEQVTSARDLALMCAAGWHICLATLEARLEGHDVPPAVGAVALEYGWAQLKDRYEELSTV